MQGISWLAANRLAAQEGLCTMEQASKCTSDISSPGLVGHLNREISTPTFSKLFLEFDVRMTVHPWYEMTRETNLTQQLWFINNPLAQHVSGITMPIFRSDRPYNFAYGFQHSMCWLGSYEAGKQAACSAQGLLPGFTSNIRSSAPEDGHNDALNMLS